MLVNIGELLRQTFRDLDLRKFDTDIESIPREYILMMLGEWTQTLHDLIQLIQVAVPSEQWLAIQQFSEHTARSPDIDCTSILNVAHK